MDLIIANDESREVIYDNTAIQDFYSDLEVSLEVTPILEVQYFPYVVTYVDINTDPTTYKSTTTMQASSLIRVGVNSDNTASFTDYTKVVEG